MGFAGLQLASVFESLFTEDKKGFTLLYTFSDFFFYAMFIFAFSM